MSWAEQVRKGQGKPTSTSTSNQAASTANQNARSASTTPGSPTAGSLGPDAAKAGTNPVTSPGKTTVASTATSPAMDITTFFTAAAAASSATNLATRDNSVARQLFLTFLSNSRGEIVLIEKIDGSIVEGLFDSFSVDQATNTFKLNLIHAIYQPSSRRADFYKDGDMSPTSITHSSPVTSDDYNHFEVILSPGMKQLIVRRSDEASITSTTLSSLHSAAARQSSTESAAGSHVGAFATDTEISKTAGRKQRELTTWTPGEDDQTNVLDESILSQAGAGNWDQFAANAKLSKALASPEGEFDMNEYSTYLDVRSEFYKQHEAEARAVEESILRGTTYKGAKVRNDEISRRERRSVELQAGEDDDRAFSAVLSTPAGSATSGATSGAGSSTGKYIPPSRRRNQPATTASTTDSTTSSQTAETSPIATSPEPTKESEVTEAVTHPTPALEQGQPEDKTKVEAESAETKPTTTESSEPKPGEAPSQMAPEATSGTTTDAKAAETKSASTSQASAETTESASGASASATTSSTGTSKIKSKLKLSAAEYVPSFLSTPAPAPPPPPTTHVSTQYMAQNIPAQTMVMQHPGGYVSHIPHGIPTIMAHPMSQLQPQVYHPGMPISPMGPMHVQGYVTHPSVTPQPGYIYRPANPNAPAMQQPVPATAQSGAQTAPMYSNRRGGAQTPPGAANPPTAPVIIPMGGAPGPVFTVPVDPNVGLVPVTVADAHGGTTVAYAVPMSQPYYTGQPQSAPTQPQPQQQVQHHTSHPSQHQPQQHYQNPGVHHGQHPQQGVHRLSHGSGQPSVPGQSHTNPRTSAPGRPQTQVGTSSFQASSFSSAVPAPPTSATPNVVGATVVNAVPSPPSVPQPPQGTPSKPSAVVATPGATDASTESNYVRIVRKSGGWSTSTTSPSPSNSVPGATSLSSPGTPSKPNAASTTSSPPSIPSPPAPASPTPVRPSSHPVPPNSTGNPSNRPSVALAAGQDKIPQPPKRT